MTGISVGLLLFLDIDSAGKSVQEGGKSCSTCLLSALISTPCNALVTNTLNRSV